MGLGVLGYRKWKPHCVSRLAPWCSYVIPYCFPVRVNLLHVTLSLRSSKFYLWMCYKNWSFSIILLLCVYFIYTYMHTLQLKAFEAFFFGLQ